MGVTGNPDAIRLYGEMFKDVPAKEPVLARETLLSPDGPLSAGLASVQNLKAFAAAEFADLKDQGIVTAGDALTLISANLGHFDRSGADGIRRLFPDVAPRDEGTR